MKIIHRSVGPIMTNCYLLIDEETKRAALIDPGENASQLAALIDAEGVQLVYILLTHGHYDHTDGVSALYERFPDAQIYLHRADAETPERQYFPLGGEGLPLLHYDEGDVLPLGALSIEVLHTPGHSKGSVCLKVGNVLFSGDTLFAGSCGRCDLPGGDWEEMLASLRRLRDLEGDYQVLPGHDRASILSREREYNMYMKRAGQEA